MHHPINITNRQQLQSMLQNLHAQTKPLWGKMTAQQMVEHLVQELEYTNGKKTCVCERPPGEAKKEKDKMVYTDAEIPKNMVWEQPPAQYRYAGLQTAVAQLIRELEAFDEYFKTPGATCVHGGFGAMDYKEWVIWHGKHFTHHFRQFGLVP
jgi:hypothetical protein